MTRLFWRLALLVAVALQGTAAWRATSFDLAFREGRQAYRAGRFETAEAAFARAHAAQSSDPSIWEWQGDTAGALYNGPPSGGWPKERASELLDAAWTGYCGAVVRAPLGTWSWTGLAQTALWHAERHDTEHVVDLAVIEKRAQNILDPWRAVAMVAARMAVELKPSGFQELDVLSRVLRSNGQLEPAQETLIRSARMMPAPSFHDWGSGERLVGPLYQAILKATREGVAGTPAFEHSSLHRDIGQFALDQGDFDTALEELRSAKATASNSEELYQATRREAIVLEELGRLDEALQSWNAVIATGLAAPIDRRKRGVLQRRMEKNADACRDLRESVRDEPADESLRLFASAACEAAGDLETAERLLKDALVVPTDHPARAKALIDFYMRIGKRSTAVWLLSTWTRDYPARDDFREWAAAQALQP